LATNYHVSKRESAHDILIGEIGWEETTWNTSCAHDDEAVEGHVLFDTNAERKICDVEEGDVQADVREKHG
jgi:hypothetical protein